ncbi:MAG: HNH endonuclease signature motif containing protein [Cyanobacteria bacterium P01_C01_bin.72]
MNNNLNDLLEQVGKIKQSFKQLNYKTNILYQTQWQEKVANGYEVWRADPSGGLKLIKEQLPKLDYKCPVCSIPLTEESATIDHLLPKSKYLGQAIALDNMLVVCNPCNASKNNQEFAEWYLKLAPVSQARLSQAIAEIQGTVKLAELLDKNK